MKLELIGTTTTQSTCSCDKSIKENKITNQTKGPDVDKYSLRYTSVDENGIPKNFLSFGPVKLPHGSETEMNRRITDAYQQYYSGQVDETYIQTTLSNVVEELRNNYVELGYDEAEIMPHIIEDVYASARLYSIQGAREVSWSESRSLAATYNGNNKNTRDWIYYNSDYYYDSESMKTALVEYAKDLGAKYGVSDLNLPIGYEKDDPRYQYNSYNTAVNEYASRQSIIGNMIDDSMVPPKNFRFFYKDGSDGMNIYPDSFAGTNGDSASIFDSVLQVWHDDWSFTGRVPVRSDARYGVSYNMYDVVNKNSTTGVPESVSSFLKNFDFFSTIQSERYFNSRFMYF